LKKWRLSWPFLLLAAAVVLFDRDGFLLVVWTAAAAHELSHLAALRLLRCPVRRMTLTPGGLRIDYRPGELSYRRDALLALAGPAGNLLTAAAGAGIARLHPDGRLFQFVGASLLLAAFNLLPALPLDGGRALLAALSLRFAPDAARRAVRAAGLALGAALLGAGLLLLLLRGGNGTLAAAGVLLLCENTLQKSPETVE